MNPGRGFDPRLRTQPGRRDPGQRRIIAIAAVVTMGLLAIIGQLWYLQVLEGGRFLDASDRNRIRIRPIAAPRGILFDRNGAPLVDNRPAFTLSLIPRELDRDPDKRDAALGRLSALIQIPYQELRDAVAKTSPDSFLPVRLRRNLSIEEMQKVEEWKLELPGVIVEVEPQRVYPNSRFAAHLLGYVREANDDQLKQGRYRRGDMVGQTGLERLLDEFLRGKDGGERIEVDAMGRPVRLVQSTEPHPGAQVVTTVNRRVQEVAEKLMEGKTGAVVVMDPRNGDVLAMVSTPAFGFGTPTGIELGTEKYGLLPAPKSPRRGRPAVWHPGETVNMSIGQGQLLVTPMQIARFMSAIANGGVLWKPRLVQRIERPERGVVWSDAGKVMGHVELSPAVWAVLRQGLWAVVNEGGTGAAARIPGLDIAGKTGTAQMIANSKASLGQD